MRAPRERLLRGKNWGWVTGSATAVNYPSGRRCACCLIWRVRCLDWQGVSGGVKAAQAGHGVIMTPTSHCYIDYRQSLKCAPAPALLRAPSACISAA